MKLNETDSHYVTAQKSLLSNLEATLAQMESEHQSEIHQALSRSFAPEMKSRIIAKLNEQHLERQRPYVEQLRRLKLESA